MPYFLLTYISFFAATEYLQWSPCWCCTWKRFHGNIRFVYPSSWSLLPHLLLCHSQQNTSLFIGAGNQSLKTTIAIILRSNIHEYINTYLIKHFRSKAAFKFMVWLLPMGRATDIRSYWISWSFFLTCFITHASIMLWSHTYIYLFICTNGQIHCRNEPVQRGTSEHPTQT